NTKLQILEILFGHRREVYGDPRQVDTLMFLEDPTADASGGDRCCCCAFHDEFESIVVEQDAVALVDVAGQPRIVGRDRPVPAVHLSSCNNEGLSFPQLEGAVTQAADPDLVTGEVLQHGNRPADLAFPGPHGLVTLGVLSGFPM